MLLYRPEAIFYHPLISLDNDAVKLMDKMGISQQQMYREVILQTFEEHNNQNMPVQLVI